MPASPPPWRWPHFTPREIACRCCGEVYDNPAAMDALERMRDAVGPLTIRSGHRCPSHNEAVGGAPASKHLQLAFDIALGGYDRRLLLRAARVAGFTGFGFAVGFLHVDIRDTPAHWFYGPESERAWKGVAP